jgi:hypothetical protein
LEENSGGTGGKFGYEETSLNISQEAPFPDLDVGLAMFKGGQITLEVRRRKVLGIAYAELKLKSGLLDVPR